MSPFQSSNVLCMVVILLRMGDSFLLLRLDSSFLSIGNYLNLKVMVYRSYVRPVILYGRALILYVRPVIWYERAVILYVRPVIWYGRAVLKYEVGAGHLLYP